jgi:hypothetical protein
MAAESRSISCLCYPPGIGDPVHGIVPAYGDLADCLGCLAQPEGVGLAVRPVRSSPCLAGIVLLRAAPGSHNVPEIVNVAFDERTCVLVVSERAAQLYL